MYERNFEIHIERIIFEFRRIRLVVVDGFLNVLCVFEIADDDEFHLEEKKPE